MIKIERCNLVQTPTSQVELGSDLEEESFSNKKGNNPYVVGMLLYVANNNRPDITFDIIKVVKFISKLKKSHSKEIEMILYYLKGTAHKGLIVKPDRIYNLDFWIYSDFNGLHGI